MFIDKLLNMKICSVEHLFKSLFDSIGVFYCLPRVCSSKMQCRLIKFRKTRFPFAINYVEFCLKYLLVSWIGSNLLYFIKPSFDFRCARAVCQRRIWLERWRLWCSCRCSHTCICCRVSLKNTDEINLLHTQCTETLNIDDMSTCLWIVNWKLHVNCEG